MPDLIRYKKAKSLRDSGMSLRDVGAALGVTPQRIRQMLKKLEQYEHVVSDAELESARRLLERNGWRCEPPNA
jgi:predicted ArsR family transcriptional regulator